MEDGKAAGIDRRTVVRGVEVLLLVVGLCFLVHTFLEQLSDILSLQAANDFHDYFYSTKAFRLNGASIYDHREMERLAIADGTEVELPAYVYPPFFNLIFLPLVGYGYYAVRILWLVMNYVFFFVSVEGLRRLCTLTSGTNPSWRLSVLAPVWALSLYHPLIDHQWEGQSNLLVLALMTWGIYFCCRRTRAHDLPGGILLSAAGLLKMFPALVWPYLLVTRRYTAAAWVAAASVLLTLVSLLFLPWREFTLFPSVVLGSVYGDLSTPKFGDHSAIAAVGRVFAVVGGAPYFLTWLVRIVPFAWFLEICRREARRESILAGGDAASSRSMLRFSQLFILMGFVMSPWWEHHLVLLIFPLYLVFHECRLPDRSRRWPLALTVVSAAWIGLVFQRPGPHPPGPWLELGVALKFPAIVALVVAIEMLIRRREA